MKNFYDFKVKVVENLEIYLIIEIIMIFINNFDLIMIIFVFYFNLLKQIVIVINFVNINIFSLIIYSIKVDSSFMKKIFHDLRYFFNIY